MAIAKTLDLVRAHRAEYEATAAPRLLEVAPAHYLALAGKGEPGGPEFRADVAALFAVAEGVRAATRARGRDFKLAHLEALWYAPRRAGGPFAWKVLLRMPEFATARDAKDAAAHAAHRGKQVARSIRIETLEEGACIQALHRGRYADVSATMGRLATAAAAAGRTLAPPVHEIYLNDPAEVGAENAETIVRHPLAAGAAKHAAPRGRDRMPGTLRTVRLAKAPQHRAREAR
jgi:hypothetical protein